MTELCGGLLLANVPESGQYFSTFKLVAMVVLLLPWLYASTWLNKDSVKTHMGQGLWSALALGSGLLSVALWFAIPSYWAGLAIYLVLVGSTLTVYVVQRNKRVKEDARVLTSQHLSGLLTRKKQRTVEVVERLKIYDALRRPVFAPPEDQPEARQAYNLAQNFLHNVILFRASDVDIAPAGDETSVKFVIDGVVQQRPSAERDDAEMVIDFVKGIAGMNVEEKRRPQTGKLSVDVGAVATDVTVASAGTTGGQRLQLRIVREAARTNLDDLGMPEDVRARLVQLNAADGGLIIVSGLRSHGVTSTLYSLLRQHDVFMQQLVTLEARRKVELENITQYEYKDQTDLAGQLAKTLRRDPDVVMVDHCEIPQAARLLCEAAQTKNVLMGSAADSSFVALAKWVKAVGDARAAVTVLKAVTCQTLLRKLCPECKEEYPPPKEMLARLNLPPQKISRFYRAPVGPRVDEKGRPVVCATCRGTGYHGRTGAFELLEMTDEIRQMIVDGEALKDIKAACRKNRMLYLQEQALRKVIGGATSIEEVVRASKAKQ